MIVVATHIYVTKPNLQVICDSHIIISYTHIIVQRREGGRERGREGRREGRRERERGRETPGLEANAVTPRE